jgi:uncharacterized ferredoxin-like protein
MNTTTMKEDTQEPQTHNHRGEMMEEDMAEDLAEHQEDLAEHQAEDLAQPQAEDLADHQAEVLADHHLAEDL